VANPSVVVAVCRVELIIPGANSLKAKRMVLRSVLDRIRARFHVSIAEVGEQDTWQRASVGFAVVSNDRAHVNSIADQITEAMGNARDCYIADRALEIISMGSTIQDVGGGT
jgi:uncharacterized protein